MVRIGSTGADNRTIRERSRVSVSAARTGNDRDSRPSPGPSWPASSRSAQAETSTAPSKRPIGVRKAILILVSDISGKHLFNHNGFGDTNHEYRLNHIPTQTRNVTEHTESRWLVGSLARWLVGSLVFWFFGCSKS
jgi:hypothetical protein